MRYFRVKKSHPAYSFVHQFFTQGDVWDQHKEQIEQLIGTNMDGNMACCVTQLGLGQVPEHLKKQFKQKPVDGIYYAKANTSIHKAWVQLAEELKLPAISETKLFMYLGVNFSTRPKIVRMLSMFDDYYIIGKDHPEWKTLLWAEELTERHFTELRLRHLSESGEKEDVAVG